MKALGMRLAARVDRLAVRERLFLFVALMAIVVALTDFLVLEPTRQRHRALTQQFDVQAQELQRLREELGGLAKETEALRPLSDALAQVEAQIAGIERARQAQNGASTDTSLTQVLGHFLRQQPGLSLVRTATLDDGEAGAPPARPAPATDRHGVELIVAGPYHELARYVRTLESAMPRLRWGPLHIDATRQPPEMRLQVYLWGQHP